MKKYYFLIIVALILGLVLTGCSLLSNVGQVPTSEQSGISSVVKSFADKNYGDITLTSSGATDSGHFMEVWDLTGSDMTISFTYDANGLVDDDPGGDWAMGDHAWAELGIREVGHGDFNPTSETGIWLATDFDELWEGSIPVAHNTFDPDPPGSPTLDLDDKLILQKVGGQGEGAYDLPLTPPAPGNNHRVWWDRDGVGPFQNDETANTDGIYEVVITLHATGATSGTAYMTINGLDQGFETDGNWNTIELTPAGMTFTGDMTKMQVFYGLYGYGATHNVSFNDITVNGCLRTIVINGCYTGVADTLFEGELISVQIQELYDAAKNHGELVRGVAVLTNNLMKAGTITGEEKGKIQSCAAQANQLPKEDGLILWLDAGKGITSPVNGNPVSAWEDQSENDNDALQGTASFQPIYVTNELNGYPVVRFNVSEKYLCHSPILTDSYTAFYVLTLNEHGIRKVYYYHAGDVNTGDLGFFAETMNKEEGWGSAGNVDTSVTVRTSELYPTPLDWRIHTHQPEALYKNGTEVEYSQRKDNVYAGNLTDIGSRSDNANLYFVGDIAEILVYDRILTVSERKKVEAYLNAKYNIY